MIIMAAEGLQAGSLLVWNQNSKAEPGAYFCPSPNRGQMWSAERSYDHSDGYPRPPHHCRGMNPRREGACLGVAELEARARLSALIAQ